MKTPDLSEITIVLGKRNSGKSTLLNHYLYYANAPWVVIDPEEDFFNLPGSITVENIDQLKTAMKEGYNRIVVHEFDPNHILKKEEYRERAMKYVEYLCKFEDFWLFIDEVDKFMDEYKVPKELYHFAHVTVSHNNCGLVLSTRQLKKINNDVCDQINNVCCFKYNSVGSNKFRDIGLKPIHINVIEGGLDNYEFLYWRDTGDWNIMNPVPIPPHLR